ncbi:hypothetical protein AC249_AIPGENE78 [Exaiptasia diaphana]|nr:hypothetical protein AC249_AIPGENE78 [Exaiptasia diaphana]
MAKNDVDSHLAQRTSYRARNMQRFNQSFETPADAKKRIEERKENKVAERKIPLSDIRKSTLKSDEQYLRLHTDEYYESLTEDTIDARLKSLGESREEEKKSYLKHIESQRHWMI